jgi:hypothetical protein
MSVLFVLLSAFLRVLAAFTSVRKFDEGKCFKENYLMGESAYLRDTECLSIASK